MWKGRRCWMEKYEACRTLVDIRQWDGVKTLGALAQEVVGHVISEQRALLRANTLAINTNEVLTNEIQNQQGLQ
jgi:hypothetical protein